MTSVQQEKSNSHMPIHSKECYRKMAEYLTSCELMRQCQWVQFQKDNHFTIFLQKYLKLYCKTENLLGKNAGCAVLCLPSQSWSALNWGGGMVEAIAPGYLCDPVRLDKFTVLMVRLNLPRFISSCQKKDVISQCYLPNWMLECRLQQCVIFLLSENLSQL